MPRLLATLVVLFAGTASAQERTHAVTPEDYFSVALVSELAVSPDGKRVAYCEARWDKAANNRRTELWVVATDGKGKPQRLTGDRAGYRGVRWSADGTAIFALANRKREAEKKPPHDGSSQVWRVALDGTDPKPVTRVAGGVTGFDYAPEANAIFYSADTSATDDGDFAKLRQQFDKVEYGHGTRKVSEVHRLNLDDWRDETIVAEKRYVRELAATRDGKRVAMITAPDDTVILSEGHSRVDVWDAASGKVSGTDEGWRKTAASPYPWLGALAWSPDGSRLAYNTVFDAYPAEVIIDEWKDGEWSAERAKRPDGIQVRGYGSPLKWLTPDLVAYLGEREGFVNPVGYDVAKRKAFPSGRAITPPESWPEHVAYAFDHIKNIGVTLIATPMETADLYVASEASPDMLRQLTNLNPQTKTWKLPSVRHITWKAPDGTSVGGVLELPPGYAKGDKLPLVVAIHGGPTTSAKADLEFDPHNGRLYFAAKGYAVLCPNYRGSTGYGDKFVTDLIGHENDIEVKDILAGIQHLVKEGIADPERVGVMGWSNGGYLTNCLITLKDPPVKIRAASSGAGILDTVAEWGFNDEPAYPIVFKKGLPWQTPDIYRKTSPTYGIGNVRTPTLIHVGGHDVRCPPGHSRMLYRALKHYQKVPTQLIVYPGEPHGLQKYGDRRAKMEWDLAWFDKYLRGAK
jgi:dipeptidyl aminopeptidase/acylaminoacyl peptidase